MAKNTPADPSTQGAQAEKPKRVRKAAAPQSVVLMVPAEGGPVRVYAARARAQADADLLGAHGVSVSLSEATVLA